MSLNIKNPETHRLAEELAKRTGESMTAAVTTAVRERLDRVRREQGASLADRLLEIGQDCAKRLKEPFRSADYDELLCDDRGLNARNVLLNNCLASKVASLSSGIKK